MFLTIMNAQQIKAVKIAAHRKKSFD